MAKCDWRVVVTKNIMTKKPVEWWIVDYNCRSTWNYDQHGPFKSREELMLKCAAMGVEINEEEKEDEELCRVVPAGA